MLKHLGPGLIITASIVGSGELIVTTSVGAEVGFTLLWFIIIGCLVKVFVQVELGRNAILEGITTLEIFDRMPGPRFIVSWIVWLWLCMFIAVFFQASGIIGGAAEVFFAGRGEGARVFWVIAVAASGAGLLLWGKYWLIQNFSTAMVALFTVFTVLAVGALARTEYAISWEQIASGLSFQLPADITTAVAAFGIIGVGATELVYYPYWCVEKGYARYVGTRQEDDPAWEARARGWLRVMRCDAWLSAVVYTGATIAFYLLGAAVLHAGHLEVTDNDMIATLSQMYQKSFGAGGLWLFLCGAFMVLYSTFFVATASNARLLSHALSLFRVVRYKDDRQRQMVTRGACVFLPALGAAIYLSGVAAGAGSVTLVKIGAVAQALMLTPLAFCGVYLRYKRTPRVLAPGVVWDIFLWLSGVSIATVGLYKFYQMVR